MKTTITVTVVFLLVGIAVPAHAYIDPGSGSMVFQLIVGGIAGVVLALKIFWRHILALVGIKSGKEDTHQQQ